MIILDTDILSLLFADHPRVSDRFRQETDQIASTIITRIEILEGRFASVLKAADAEQLRVAQERLRESEESLATVPILWIDQAAEKEFERLRRLKKLKAIGRGDLLIASIALGHRATLNTRNVRHFSQVPGLRVENWAD
jgi:tRNA(fMet)-specific endonuclease VapC